MAKIWMPIVAIVLSAALLFGLQWGLSGVKQANAQAQLQEKMEELLPGSHTFTAEEYTGEDANIHQVYKGEGGYVIATLADGYAGKIAMLIGVSDAGTVTGLQVRDMEETPGLGGRALTDVEFLSQFLGTKGDVELGTNADALTGATVTSRAIVRSVNSAVGFVTGADTNSGATSWGG